MDMMQFLKLMCVEQQHFLERVKIIKEHPDYKSLTVLVLSLIVSVMVKLLASPPECL